jgi:hypothetical protein
VSSWQHPYFLLERCLFRTPTQKPLNISSSSNFLRNLPIRNVDFQLRRPYLSFGVSFDMRKIVSVTCRYHIDKYSHRIITVSDRCTPHCPHTDILINELHTGLSIARIFNTISGSVTFPLCNKWMFRCYAGRIIPFYFMLMQVTLSSYYLMIMQDTLFS